MCMNTSIVALAGNTVKGKQLFVVNLHCYSLKILQVVVYFYLLLPQVFCFHLFCLAHILSNLILFKIASVVKDMSEHANGVQPVILMVLQVSMPHEISHFIRHNGLLWLQPAKKQKFNIVFVALLKAQFFEGEAAYEAIVAKACRQHPCTSHERCAVNGRIQLSCGVYSTQGEVLLVIVSRILKVLVDYSCKLPRGFSEDGRVFDEIGYLHIVIEELLQID